MMRRRAGFTLIELLVVVAILGLVLAGISDMFINLLGQYKQQGKISESNIEGVIGLELLRQDLERAGYGLPWVMGGVTYSEATDAPASDYNEPAGNPPRPIMSGNNLDFVNGANSSDYLVIRATNIIRNPTAQRWSYLTVNGAKYWQPASAPENLDPNDRVIVLSPGATDAQARTLVTGLDSSGTNTTWQPLFSEATVTGAGFMPTDPQSPANWVYGVYDSALQMPFNRADYYISKTTVGAPPQRCAPNTGELVKSMISQSNGTKADHLPLLDCVASMQVVYRLDTDGNGTIDQVTDDVSALSAQEIRQQVKEIRVYILTHEGQMDKNYTYPTTTIYVGDPLVGRGKDFNIGAYTHYRWKLYTIVVQPENMRQS